MSRKRNYAAAFLFSLFCAWAACGCLVTAFEIPLEAPWPIALVWALACGASMGILTAKKGGWLLLGLDVLLGILVWRSRELCTSLLGLVRCIAEIYDGGYGWGVPEFLSVKASSCDPAVMLLGVLVIQCVCTAVLRRHGGWLATASLLLPLATCLVVTDTVPETACLFGLLLGLVLLLLTDNVRTESTSQGVNLLAGMLLPAALALGLVFSVWPKDAYQNPAEALRQQALQYVIQLPEKVLNGQLSMQGLTPMQQRVNLANLPAQPQLGLPVAEVAADWNGSLYLRLKDYDIYTGTAWQSSGSRPENISGAGAQTGIAVVRELSAQGGKLLPAFPAGETLLTGGTADADGETVYRVDCMAEAMAARPEENWLVLPEETALRAGNLLSRIPGNLDSIRNTANAIAAYVSSSAEYDRRPSAMPGDETDFAAWFLESGERGYCIHFATAATVLLRSAGIPARYVTGFRVDTTAGETVHVTSNDAHAWAEYYDSGTWTWVILEATPPDLTTEPTIQPTETTAQTEPVSQTETTQETSAPAQRLPEPQMPEEKRPFPVKAVLEILLVFALTSLVEVQRQLRIRLRRRRQKRSSANVRALLMWQEVNLLFRLRKEVPPDDLTELTEKAMFSQHALTAAELHRFTIAASRCRRALRQAAWWKRLVYRYWYAVI